MGVVGDAATTAETFLRWREELDHVAAEWASTAAPGGADGPVEHGDADASTVEIDWVVRQLDGLLPRDRTLVYDTGRFWFAAIRALFVPEPRYLVHTFNYASIGLGMGTGVGAAVAMPDRTTVVLVGDGGFMLGGLADLAVAARYELDLVVVVFNDGCYGAEHAQLRGHQLDTGLSLQQWPDIAAVATGLGAASVRWQTRGDVDAVVDALARRRGPLLIDVHLDPDRVPLRL